MLDKARRFAAAAHEDMMYGQEPYITHLDAVVTLLEPYGDVAKAIGYLHDVAEDAEVDIRTLQDEFGEFVANCVSLMTDEPGKNRRERKKATYARLKQVKGKEELALVVSAADRLANLQACIAIKNKENEKLLKMYRAEHDAFRDAVYRQDLCEDLWSRIQAAIGT